MVVEVDISDRKVGRGHTCFIIAEAGVNHNGDLGVAHHMIDAAALAGVDAVKFQTFNAEQLVTNDAPKAGYQEDNTNPKESSYDMLRRLELPLEGYRELKDHCDERGVVFLSTPFSIESVDFLDALGMKAFKIASGEVTNLPLVAHISKKAKPLVVSTGMSYLGEVEKAVQTIEGTGNRRFVLLHCVSCYPAQAADANLRAMFTLAKAFESPVGYSDHTMGTEVALAAVALGACMIEKHFTLDRTLPGPDQSASLEADELKALVKGIRNVELSIGNGRKQPVAKELSTAAVARKSLVAAQDIPSGTTLQAEMIEIKRPGTGLPPSMLPDLIGRTMSRSISKGTLFTMKVLL